MHLFYQNHFMFFSKYLMAACFSVIAGILIASVCNYQFSNKLTVQILDTSGNYILIKENHIYECKENLYFLLPLGSKGIYQVSVNDSFFINMIGRKYCFRIKEKGSPNEVYKVTFRQIQPQSLNIKKQIFYLKLPSSIYENPNM